MTQLPGETLEDPLQEALRLVEQAQRRGAAARLMGGSLEAPAVS